MARLFGRSKPDGCAASVELAGSVAAATTAGAGVPCDAAGRARGCRPRSRRTGGVASGSVLAVLLALLAGLSSAEGSSIHTVVTTECSAYFTWQTMGMFFSHRKSGQPGPITRIMCCTNEEYERLPAADRELVPTHVAPSYTIHPRNGDIYSAYNKPLAIIDWLAKTDVAEDYVLVIDADMIMRAPFTAESVGAHPGLAASAFFPYMKGVKNALAMKHVPEVVPRNDTVAGPRGRRGDMVGGFTLMHTEDLRRVGPWWLKFTEDVRFDPDAWELSGDAYSTHKGDQPWISEMYGYSFGCAKADVWHTVPNSAMLYPGYDVAEPPKVLHYGLTWEVVGTKYSFGKHWHYDFNPLVCPPWNVGNDSRQSKKGLFAHAPSPRAFQTTGDTLLRDLMSVEVPITLNAAFCERHRKVCPPSDELERECSRAEALMREYDEVLAAHLSTMPDPCRDLDERCGTWAKGGECDKNQGFMADHCRLSCKVCTPRTGAAPTIQDKEVVVVVKAIDTASGSAGSKPADNVRTVIRVNQQQQQQAQQGQAAAANPVLQAIKIADSAAKLRGGGVLTQANAAPNAAAAIKALRLECTDHEEWTLEQIKECVRLAKQGLPYKLDLGQEQQADGEQGQRQEQQLHEVEALQQQQGGGGSAQDAAATGRMNERLNEGRLLGETGSRHGGADRRAQIQHLGANIRHIGTKIGSKMSGEAEAVGATRLAILAVLLWLATLLLAFCLLPWAKSKMRRKRSAFVIASGGGGGKGFRDD